MIIFINLFIKQSLAPTLRITTDNTVSIGIILKIRGDLSIICLIRTKNVLHGINLPTSRAMRLEDVLTMKNASFPMAGRN